MLPPAVKFPFVLLLVTAACGDGGTLASLPPPPPTGRLYFAGAKHIPYFITVPYALDPAEGNPTEVPIFYESAHDERISPDGTTLVYLARFRVTAENVSTREIRYLTNGSSFDRFPTWSPDQSRVMVVRDPYISEPFKLVELRADGSGERDVRRLPEDYGGSYSVSWSANAQFVYLLRGGPVTTVERVPVNDPAAKIDTVARGPKRWAIHRGTGKAAALWYKNPDSDSVEVSTWDPATSQFTHVGNYWSPGGASLDEVAWSPDGRYIAVLSETGRDLALWIFDAIERRRYSRRVIPPPFEYDNQQGLSWGPVPP